MTLPSRFSTSKGAGPGLFSSTTVTDPSVVGEGGIDSEGVLEPRWDDGDDGVADEAWRGQWMQRQVGGDDVWSFSLGKTTSLFSLRKERKDWPSCCFT